MKCDCGWVITRPDGKCLNNVHLKEHAREMGVESKKGGRSRYYKDTQDMKRCPNCRGDSERWSGKGVCAVSLCNRGPGGKQCGCHYRLTGMGSPGEEGRINKKPEVSPLWQSLHDAGNGIPPLAPRRVC